MHVMKDGQTKDGQTDGQKQTQRTETIKDIHVPIPKERKLT